MGTRALLTRQIRSGPSGVQAVSLGAANSDSPGSEFFSAVPKSGG